MSGYMNVNSIMTWLRHSIAHRYSDMSADGLTVLKEVNGMIQVEHLSKSFKVVKKQSGMMASLKSLFHHETVEIKALDDISFNIKKGEIVAYIGPNGAGKSTSIKILSGILTPDQGKVIVNGKVPWLERVDYVKDIGVVFGQRSQLWWDVPIIDSFKLLKDIYMIDENDYKQRLAELSELLKLEALLQIPARQLSLGQRMRCELAASLLHAPSILFLDEPTIGLDAVSKLAVREFILKLNKRNETTIILTTHDMQDIEALCQRVLLIGKGKLLYDGTLDDLKKQYAYEKRITLLYHGDLILPEHCKLIETKNMMQQMSAQLEIDTRFITTAAVIKKLTSEMDIKEFSIAEKSIDEMVAMLYQQFEIL